MQGSAPSWSDPRSAEMGATRRYQRQHDDDPVAARCQVSAVDRRGVHVPILVNGVCRVQLRRPLPSALVTSFSPRVHVPDDDVHVCDSRLLSADVS